MDLSNYPLLKAKAQTPFMLQLIGAYTKGEGVMSVNGQPMPHAIWNLICSHRDLKMWCELKMKPHRNWKVSQVKTYFGIKGNGAALLQRFEALKSEADLLVENINRSTFREK